jgi:DNA-binding NarL/FixJ family response regulator
VESLDEREETLERRAPSSEVEALVEERESERELHRLVSDEGLAAAGLSPRQLEIVRLKREGLTEGEIARRLGVSQAAVSKGFRAAVGKLRRRARDS